MSRSLLLSPVLVMSLVAACSRDTALAGGADKEKPLPVLTHTVAVEEARRPIEIVGTLTATEEATVSAEVEGRVLRIVADLGDRVPAGGVLMELAWDPAAAWNREEELDPAGGLRERPPPAGSAAG